jgi:hypothetical protein
MAGYEGRTDTAWLWLLARVGRRHPKVEKGDGMAVRVGRVRICSSCLVRVVGREARTRES